MIHQNHTKVISHGFGLQFANYPLVGMRGVIVGIVIYFTPGLIGAWIAVEIVRQIERSMHHELGTSIIQSSFPMGDP
jgi:hypothetical protein